MFSRSDSPDEVVFAAAQSNGCVMITCNRDDFLRLAAKAPHGGLIILIRRRSPQVECANLLKLIGQAGEQGLVANINFA
jgi:hypothetical protein